MPPGEASSPKIRALIVDDITETRENVRKLLYFENDIEIVGGASNGREGVEMAGKLQPDVVLMDINMPEMDGIAASEAIVAQHPNIQIIMMSVQGEADYLRRSMLAGAREFLIKPFSGEELATSIRRVHQLAANRRVVVAPPPTSVETPTPTPKKGGKIIAVFGCKGGCGASTIAVNLAVALKEETHERVAILDANLEFGDIGVLLNLPTSRTIADLVEAKTEIEEEMLNGVMASHSSGIKALLAPPRPEMAELVTLGHLKKLLDLMPRMFDYVVIDVWRTFSDSMIPLLDAADQIVLISTNDIPAIKNAKLFFELCEALGYPPDKTRFVVNKEDGRSGIGVKDIEASVKHGVHHVLPKDERTTGLAANRGMPFVTIQRNIPLSQAVIGLAAAIRRPPPASATPAPTSSAAPQKAGWLRRK